MSDWDALREQLRDILLTKAVEPGQDPDARFAMAYGLLEIARRLTDISDHLYWAIENWERLREGLPPIKDDDEDDGGFDNG